MPIARNRVEPTKFNSLAQLPYELRLEDFSIAMQDVYDFFFDVNTHLAGKGLQRLDDMLRPAIMSGLLSDMLTSSLAKHSRSLTENRYHNGHPDLIVRNIYPNDAVRAGTEGVEIKTTRNRRGAVDTHGAREQWMCIDRRPMTFYAVYLSRVTVEDFRRNPRSELGTRTATLHREGVAKLHTNWVYRL